MMRYSQKNERNIPNDRSTISILFLGCFTAMICASIYFFYAHPVADDYYYAGVALYKNPAEATIERYFEWSGRWGSHLIEFSAYRLLGLLKYYHILIISSFLIFILSLNVFFNVLLGRIFQKKEIFIFSLVFISVFWSSIPSPAELFYWFIGSVENLMSISLVMLWVSFVIKASGAQPLNRSIIKIICGTVFSVFAASYHELTSVIVCLMIVFMYLLTFTKKHKTNFIQHTLFIAFFLGTLFVVLAPGNIVRRESEALDSIQSANSLHLMVSQMYGSVPGWLFDIRLISSGLLFALVLWEKLSIFPQSTALNSAWKYVSVIVWPLSLFAAFSILSIALQYPMPARALDQLFFLYAFGLYFNILTAVVTWDFFREVPISPACSLFFKRFLAVVFTLSVILSGNTQKAYYDFRTGVLPRFDNEMKEFDRSINSESVHGAKQYDFTEIKNLPWLLYNVFPTEDKNFYVNRCMAAYYGLSVVLNKKD